ncbi:ATP-dependent DNA helicase RecG [Sulfurospirillum sp. 1612]|uniref:ATP-dependent DNA helicase RecG n=1 Tax=Sulfurospirillum sp. 1612 TaxID=3094835 RepID=UPI002F92102D
MKRSLQLQSEEDQKKFDKLRIDSILGLALLIPKSYDNSFITQTPQLNQKNCIEVEVQHVSKTPKALSLDLFCITWNEKIKGVIFRPSFYHTKIFKPGSLMHVRGKIVWGMGKIQIQQPQVLKAINTITSKYKTALSNEAMRTLVKKYVTKEALISEGMSDKDATNLWRLHHPDLDFLYEFEKNGYPHDIKETLKYAEIYHYLDALSKKNITYLAKNRLEHDAEPFIATLPFDLTPGQRACIDAIKQDFQSSKAAKRLIMGDVGCGKTIVMLAAVMMAYPKRTILMVPTTVLANQIYEEAIKFLPSNVTVAKVVQQSSKEIDLETFDFIIGTHALLFRKLPETDLVMVDEQHRFGTNQRATISNIAKVGNTRAHFLQFSATPIPRTLSMMHASVIDFSYIKELPFKKDIETHIIGKSKFPQLIGHLKDEIAKGHQAIIVYPLVEESEVIDYQSIEEGRGYWEKNFEHVFVTYGKDKNKEETLQRFRDEGNILVSTTVIEVGISLPKLTTIVLVAPERLGLASLHQLRGRVSRNGLKGYCYLYTNLEKSDRLSQFAKTTNGFEIAELDLQYRAGGDMLRGIFQSGNNFVWFDMAEDHEILKKAKAAMEYNGA